jgi:Flp pilus assembly protein TadD
MRFLLLVSATFALGAALFACAPSEVATTAPTIVVTAPTTSAPAPLILQPSNVTPTATSKRTRAQPPPVAHDPARAEALFNEARQAMNRGDYAAACELFAESNAYDPADGTLANLAACEEKIGDYVNARTHWQQVFDNSTRAGRNDRAALARQRIDAIDQKLSGGP